MSVVIGRLDVIAARPEEPPGPPETAAGGPTALEVERVLERSAEMRRRREAD